MRLGGRGRGVVERGRRAFWGCLNATVVNAFLESFRVFMSISQTSFITAACLAIFPSLECSPQRLRSLQSW